jgi:hypothetical protein
VKVVDDFIEPMLADNIYETVNAHYGFHYGRKSYGGKKKKNDSTYLSRIFYQVMDNYTLVNTKDSFQKFLLVYMQEKLNSLYDDKKCYIKDLHFNARTNEMTDVYHQDSPFYGMADSTPPEMLGKHFTANVFLRPKELTGGGLDFAHFENIRFKPGRLAVFDSSEWHKAESFEEENTLRVTMTVFGDWVSK